MLANMCSLQWVTMLKLRHDITRNPMRYVLPESQQFRSTNIMQSSIEPIDTVRHEPYA